MKNKTLRLSILLFLIIGSLQGFSQGKTSKAKVKPPVLKRYHLADDKDGSNKVTLAQALAWADTLPLKVIGTDKKVVYLHQYELSIISMNPLQTKQYGTGNDGIPLMARREMDNLKPGDSVYFSDVIVKDEKDVETKAANLIFSIKE